VKALKSDGSEDIEVVSSVSIDLRDADAVSRLFKNSRPRLVYHLAARVHGLGGNTRFPAEMFTDNVRINTNVIEYAHRAGCDKIVAVGTVAAYPSNAVRPICEESIWLGPPHGSELAYGHAKRAMLAQLEAYKLQYGLNFVNPLLTNVYGPYDRFDVEHGHVVPSLVAKFARAKREGGAVHVWGTGRAQRDFISAVDAARALILLADRGEGAINVATGKTVKIADVVSALAEHSGVDSIIWDSSKPDGQLERSYDVSKLEALGFEPRVSLSEGLATTLAWYQKNYPNVRS
jgi:GDP-L-fucose synthase